MPEQRSAFLVVAELLGNWIYLRRRDNGYMGTLNSLPQDSLRVAADTHCSRGRIYVHQTSFLFFLSTGITFSASFAVRDGYAIEFWRIECEWKWCTPLSGLAPQTLSCTILHAWSCLCPPDCCPRSQQHCRKYRALTWKEPGFLDHTVEGWSADQKRLYLLLKQ